jgi:hypothetical protein
MEQPANLNQPLEDLKEIRTIMERSSRFISLSGLSGVFVGIFALIGEYIAISHFKLHLVNNWLYADNHLRNLPLFGYDNATSLMPGWSVTLYPDFIYFMIDALIVLFLSVSTAILLTWRRANKNGYKIWDSTAKRLIVNLLIPLAAGGIFCIAMLYQHYYELIIPATLIFYGIALFNAGKYTLNDIRYLGIIEIALGLSVCFRMQYSLIFWGLGFGVFHIIYGIIMYYKYER